MSRFEWTLLVLLILSIFINYIDRANLSVAAPLLRREEGFSYWRVGLLLSAFSWTYALLQFFGIAGWLADRFPVSLVLAVSFSIWSAATIATGLLTGFAAIFAARLVLGAGESVAYPCYSRIFATNIPQHHRGRANALLDASSKLGPAVAIVLGGLLLERFGWRPFFIAQGVASLIWLIPWLRCTAALHASAGGNQPADRVSGFELLSIRSAWGTFAGHFCGNYLWFFLLTWLPSYLIGERRLSFGGMSAVTSLAFVAVALATVCAGWFSDWWIASGASPTRVRKTIVVVGLGFSSVILPVAFVSNATTCFLLLITACLS
ncbi:MAG: MFS transporter, partial [Acidobacteriaceae bacterium]|nr:MFS transporter [Acidobacteriaceae bacterium]